MATTFKSNFNSSGVSKHLIVSLAYAIKMYAIPDPYHVLHWKDYIKKVIFKETDKAVSMVTAYLNLCSVFLIFYMLRTGDNSDYNISPSGSLLTLKYS